MKSSTQKSFLKPLGFLCAASLAVSAAAGQSMEFSGAKAIQSRAKHGGTYHVATGTWTRSGLGSVARGTTDVIYNNSAECDLYAPGEISLQTDSFKYVDAGRIPSTGTAGTANRSNYNISNVSIGYCIEDNAAAAADVLITIYGSYASCDDPALHACSGEFLGMGLPGASPMAIAGGFASCWIVNFDLTGGEEICILGDGDGVLDGDLDLDSFGIGIEFDPGGAGGYVGAIPIGPIVAGDRSWTVQAIGELTPSSGAGVPGCAVASAGGGGGTYYGPTECCTSIFTTNNSSGLDNQDQFWAGDRPGSNSTFAGCYWFGGYVNDTACNADGGLISNPNLNNEFHGGFYVIIEADQTSNCVPTDCSPGAPITTFCDPAINNSSGTPAVLSGTFGSGTGSDLHLDVSGGPLPLAGGSRMLGYYLVGNRASTGVPISDGNFCLIGNGGSFQRYNTVRTSNSISLFDAAGDLENFAGTGGPTGYGFDVPDRVNLAGIPPVTIMFGDTYHFQCWYRDTGAGSGHSNFTNGLSVTFP